MAAIRGILFDFDGVVVDSTPVHLEGWAVAYKSLFKAELPKVDLDTLVGRSTGAIATILTDKNGEKNAKNELIKRKIQYVHDHIKDIPLIPGIEDFLHLLQTKNLPFAVASNAPKAFLKEVIEKHSLPFPIYLGLEDYVKPKPDPEPYLKAARRLGFDFKDYPDLIVFEDSTHGLDAARDAYMQPVGVCSQHSAAHLLDAGAKATIESFLEVESLLRICKF